MLVDEAVAAVPAGPVRRFVRAYHGYRQAGVAPAVHRGLPSPWLTLIFTLDDPLQLTQHVDGVTPPGVYATLVGGLHAAPAVIVHQGRQSGIQLMLDPLGARAVLGLPAGELGGLDLPADLVLGRAADRIRDRLRSAADWEDRFAVLDQELTRLVLAADERAADAVPAALDHAWRRLLGVGGKVTVAALASEVGWSERQLARRFRADVGLTPKTAARVVRFDRARRMLQAPDGPTAAEVAATCGYVDQSHLNRDFTEFAGCAPRRWLAEEVGNVQAVAGSAAAESWA